MSAEPPPLPEDKSQGSPWPPLPQEGRRGSAFRQTTPMNPVKLAIILICSGIIAVCGGYFGWKQILENNARVREVELISQHKYEAELVVTATPIEVNDSGVTKQATFEVIRVHKGDPKIKTFVFHYLRMEMPVRGGPTSYPFAVSFDPEKRLEFLMFLKRAPEGGFISVTGRIYPLEGPSYVETGPLPDDDTKEKLPPYVLPIFERSDTKQVARPSTPVRSE